VIIIIIITRRKFLLEKVVIAQMVKKFPELVGDTKIRYRVHNIALVNAFLSQMNPVHILISLRFIYYYPLIILIIVDRFCVHMRVYPRVSGLATWSKNSFCESV